TLRMCSMSATEVPPNFITRRAMVGLRLLRRESRRAPLYGKPSREKARIHTGGRRMAATAASEKIDGDQDGARTRLNRRRGGGGAVFRARRRMVGSGRPDGHAAQVQPCAARFHQAVRMPA